VKALTHALGRMGLSARIFAILALVLALDVATNAFLLERANDFALTETEAAPLARRIAEAQEALSHLPPAERADYARAMSDAKAQFSWLPQMRGLHSGIQLATLQEQLIRHQPTLARARLQILATPLELIDGVAGSLVLPDGTALEFHNQTAAVWPLMLGHVVNFLAPTAAFALLAWLLTYASLRPLRMLVRASAMVGTRRASAMEIAGPGEVQALIGAFNSMQERIDGLLDANRETMLAIAHDLRTPLARLQLRSDSLKMPDEDRDALEHDLGEIRDLLASLQS